jgi:hypothetical protein
MQSSRHEGGEGASSHSLDFGLFGDQAVSQGLDFCEQDHKQGHVFADSFLQVAFLAAVVGQLRDVLFVLFFDVSQADHLILEHFQVDLERGLIDLAQSLNFLTQGSDLELQLIFMLGNCLFIPIILLTLDPLAANNLL